MKGIFYKGSMTIEISLLLPFILSLFVSTVITVFYYHDKDIMSGAAYETVVWGSSMMREESELDEAELVEFCKDRLRRKCIFLTSQTITASIQEEEIGIEVTAKKRGFRASVVKKAKLTEPEKRIRDIRRVENINGTKNND